MLSHMMHAWLDEHEQQTSVQAGDASRTRHGRRLLGVGACLGVALAMTGAPSVEASPLMHWTWEGIGDTPTDTGGDTDYWWVDKINGVELRLGTHPERHELVETGPGSSFSSFSATGSEYGITNPSSFARTAYPQPLLDRDITTTEVFFNPAASAVESGSTEGRLVRIEGGASQQQLVVDNGTIGARLYAEENGQWTSTVYNPSFLVEADKDYYAAFAISTGDTSADRFIDFYLMDLTEETPVLQHERVAIGDQFTSLRYDSNGSYFAVGEGDYFNMIGEVRYSDGVLDQGDLMVIPEPAAATLLLGTLPFVLFGRQSRQARRRGA